MPVRERANRMQQRHYDEVHAWRSFQWTFH
jgi:hypothetical protein